MLGKILFHADAADGLRLRDSAVYRFKPGGFIKSKIS